MNEKTTSLVYLLGRGWPVTQMGDALMMDRETTLNHYKRYRKGGLACTTEI